MKNDFKRFFGSLVFDKEYIIVWKIPEAYPLSAILLWYGFRSFSEMAPLAELVSDPQSILEINFTKAKHIYT